MPFQIDVFQENIEAALKGPIKEKLRLSCGKYQKLKTPVERVAAIQSMITLLDEHVTVDERNQIMRSCGRRCIGSSVISKAVQLSKQANNLDDLLSRLNDAHIGGGHLYRKGDVIHAEYRRCYCGSVSRSMSVLSPTYCQCSCGWYQQLFESICGGSVTVELVSSIIQGDSSCRFKIHLAKMWSARSEL